MFRHSVKFMRKHKYILFVPVLTIIFCWTLMTDATENEPGTLQYLELFSQCFELVQSRYLEETDPRILAEGAVEGMLLATSPYSALLPVSGFSGLIPEYGPIDLGIVIGFKSPMMEAIDVFPGSVADENGIIPGDTIIRINDQVTPYLTIDRARRMLTGKAGDTVKLLTQSHLTGELNELEIVLQAYEASKSELTVTTLEGFRLIQLRGEILSDTPDRLYDELTQLGQSVPTILDLRHLNQGNEVIGIQVADIFVADKSPLLNTCSLEDVILSQFISNDDRALIDFPLTVIIDSTSAGPAETCAAALQGSGRATVTGDPSFGKAVYQEIRKLDDAYNITMVIGLFCSINGKLIHSRGVLPDIPVVLPPVEGVDPYLNTAKAQVSVLASSL